MGESCLRIKGTEVPWTAGDAAVTPAETSEGGSREIP